MVNKSFVKHSFLRTEWRSVSRCSGVCRSDRECQYYRTIPVC